MWIVCNLPGPIGALVLPRVPTQACARARAPSASLRYNELVLLSLQQIFCSRRARVLLVVPTTTASRAAQQPPIAWWARGVRLAAARSRARVARALARDPSRRNRRAAARPVRRSPTPNRAEVSRVF